MPITEIKPNTTQYVCPQCRTTEVFLAKVVKCEDDSWQTLCTLAFVCLDYPHHHFTLTFQADEGDLLVREQVTTCPTGCNFARFLPLEVHIEHTTRFCPVCSHRSRILIDKALGSGQRSVGDTAKAFGFRRQSVARHLAEGHIPPWFRRSA